MDPLSSQTPNSINSVPAEHKKIGPIIAILVIVLVLVIGALYLLASRVNREQSGADTMVNSTDAASEQQAVSSVTNAADDVDSINSDLNASTRELDNKNF